MIPVLTMMMMIGRSGGVTINLTNFTAGDTEVGTAQISVTVQRDGNIAIVGNNSTPPPATDYADPDSATVGDDYHARMVTGTGDQFDAGEALDSWLALTADKTWSKSISPIAFADGTHTLEISDDAGSTTLASCTVTIDMEAAV